MTPPYQHLLTQHEIAVLMTTRIDSRRLFDVGDIAEQACQRQKENRIPKFLILSAVGEVAGIGGKRVEQLRKIALFYPEDERVLWKEMPFSYFEEAFAFPPEDAHRMLEFADHWFEENGRWPGSDHLAYLYRKHVLGEVVDNSVDVIEAEVWPELAAPDEPPALPASAQKVPDQERKWYLSQIESARTLEGKLHSMLSRWQKTSNLTREQCITELEVLLGDTEQPIT